MRRGLGRRELVHVFTQVAETLQLAHDKGIVHRDLKPDNVFLVNEAGDPLFVKLLDFGIAKILHGDVAPAALTETGVILGTPYYMSPGAGARRGRRSPERHLLARRDDVPRLHRPPALRRRLDDGRAHAPHHRGARSRRASIGAVDQATERMILRCMAKRRRGSLPEHARGRADAAAPARAARPGDPRAHDRERAAPAPRSPARRRCIRAAPTPRARPRGPTPPRRAEPTRRPRSRRRAEPTRRPSPDAERRLRAARSRRRAEPTRPSTRRAAPYGSVAARTPGPAYTPPARAGAGQRLRARARRRPYPGTIREPRDRRAPGCPSPRWWAGVRRRPTPASPRKGRRRRCTCRAGPCSRRSSALGPGLPAGGETTRGLAATGVTRPARGPSTAAILLRRGGDGRRRRRSAPSSSTGRRSRLPARPGAEPPRDGAAGHCAGHPRAARSRRPRRRPALPRPPSPRPPPRRAPSRAPPCPPRSRSPRRRCPSAASIPSRDPPPAATATAPKKPASTDIRSPFE